MAGLFTVSWREKKVGIPFYDFFEWDTIGLPATGIPRKPGNTVVVIRQCFCRAVLSGQYFYAGSLVAYWWKIRFSLCWNRANIDANRDTCVSQVCVPGTKQSTD